MEVKGYQFLAEHEHYERTREFSEYNIYVFRRYLDDENYKVGTLQLPTTIDGTFNWYFSNEEVEPWFQELIDKSERKAEELFRIKRVIEGKM